jgi:hypothetical protein
MLNCRKKKILLIFIMLFAESNSIDINNKMFFSSIGTDISYSEDDKLFAGFNASLADYYYWEQITGLGFKLSPMQYHYYQSNHIFNPIGITPYWNILSLIMDNKMSLLGPFSTFNYPSWNSATGLDHPAWNFAAGLIYSYSGYNGYSDYRVFDDLVDFEIEAGYKHANKTGSFYFGIKIASMYIFAIPVFLGCCK